MDSPEVQLEGYIHGVDDFLQKPVDERLLKLKIQRQLYIADLKKENLRLRQSAQMIKLQIDQVLDKFL